MCVILSECSCEDWKTYRHNECRMLVAAMFNLKMDLPRKSYQFCPWCGTKLKFIRCDGVEVDSPDCYWKPNNESNS